MLLLLKVVVMLIGFRKFLLKIEMCVCILSVVLIRFFYVTLRKELTCSFVGDVEGFFLTSRRDCSALINLHSTSCIWLRMIFYKNVFFRLACRYRNI